MDSEQKCRDVEMSKPIKILCSGDVNGSFTQLINRVNAVNKKAGPFDALFSVGEFFGPDMELNDKVRSGEIEFPLPTYILGESLLIPVIIPSITTYHLRTMLFHRLGLLPR